MQQNNAFVKSLLALACGLLFGLGLIVSGMVNPAKVLGFLDIAGNWDPSLAFVMGGALAVTLPGYRIITRRKAPLFEGVFHLPSKSDLDKRLILGAAIFGVGWGLAGLCPGPAFTALLFGKVESLIFLAAMIVGFLLYRLLPKPAP